MEKSRVMLPMVEGKCPPVHAVDVEGEYWYYPEPYPDYVDPNIHEYEKYSIEDKDEFYYYVTRCKNCGARFIAYDFDWNETRNYCPGCGKRLD